MKIAIKPFATPNGKYIYDRETNSLLVVSDSEYESFKNIYENKTNEDDLHVLKSYQSKGFCKESLPEKIEHPLNGVLEFIVGNKMEKITLQVTQNCNLKCSYCAYSGNYKQRSHSDKRMPYEVMQKCVDFAMRHSTNSARLDVGFYGGEPLLEVSSIRKLVKYISSKYPHKDVTYTMTTNGTMLFGSDVIEFLSKNNFNVMVSIDGPKELHDRNRVFESGEGSFDVLMDNLTRIKEDYPDYYRQISFNAVVAPNNDYQCVSDFFSASDVLSNNTLQSSILN